MFEQSVAILNPVEALKKKQEKLGKDTNVITNGDRIRAMSDEELAESLEAWQDWGGGLTKESWLEWLKELAEVSDG